MAAYPQLATGAVTQFPIHKRWRQRTVVNRALDGSSIKLADPAAQVTEWQLEYATLTDDELATLQQFFATAEGTLQTFTFLDPAGNLLKWSEALDQSAWVKAPLLTVAGGNADPLGGTGAWLVTNTGGGAQTIEQTLQAPSGYTYCFSAYTRAAQPVTVTMLRGADRSDQAIGTDWRRITFGGASAAGADSITFGLELAAGVSLDVFGLQVEPQLGASAYKPTGAAGGVYEDARFRDDAFSFTTTDVGRHSAAVNIIHVNHL